MSEDVFTVHADAFKAAITAKLREDNDDPTTQWQAFDYDELSDLEEDDTPGTYVVITLTLRFGGTERMSGGPPTITGWRLTTEVNSTSIYGIRWAEARVAALRGVEVPVPCFATTPLEFESSEGPQPDQNIYSSNTFWTFASSPSS